MKRISLTLKALWKYKKKSDFTIGDAIIQSKEVSIKFVNLWALLFGLPDPF